MIFVIGIVLTLLQCFKKWHWLDWYGAHFDHIKWMPKSYCALCLGFWLSWPVMALVELFPWWVLMPFACAGFINLLLTYEKD